MLFQQNFSPKFSQGHVKIHFWNTSQTAEIFPLKARLEFKIFRFSHNIAQNVSMKISFEKNTSLCQELYFLSCEQGWCFKHF